MATNDPLGWIVGPGSDTRPLVPADSGRGEFANTISNVQTGGDAGGANPVINQPLVGGAPVGQAPLVSQVAPSQRSGYSRNYMDGFLSAMRDPDIRNEAEIFVADIERQGLV